MVLVQHLLSAAHQYRMRVAAVVESLPWVRLRVLQEQVVRAGAVLPVLLARIILELQGQSIQVVVLVAVVVMLPLETIAALAALAS